VVCQDIGVEQLRSDARHSFRGALVLEPIAFALDARTAFEEELVWSEMEDSSREEPLLEDPGTREQRMPGDR
jgi:hypothetical protein